VVIPASLAMKCLGSNYARAFGLDEQMRAKTILSLNDPALNPSMANYLVPQEYRAQLQMLPFDQPTLLNRVTVIGSVTGNVTFPGLSQTDSNEFGGVSFSWTQEANAKPETEPVFTQIEIPTYELSGYTEISERALSRSALPLESLLVSIFRPAMNYTLDNVIVNGTGTAQPLGILTAAGVRVVGRAAANTVGDTDLVNLKHAVKPTHRAGAMFALSDSAEQELELATDSFGRPLFRASTANGPYDRLVGYPYSVATNCPAVGTEGDVIYGNMRWYFLVMEEEITVARSEHYRFRNNVISFKVFVVVGGRPMQPRAFAKLGDVGAS
jgi:HK97 family phage major capsid protein